MIITATGIHYDWGGNLRFLVTGCAGFIGSHLTEALLRDGHTVVGIDRLSTYYDVAVKQRNLAGLSISDGFSLLEIDLAETRLSGDCLAVDGVFHLAAQAGVRASWGDGFNRYVRDNMLATQQVVDAFAGVCRVVLASSSSIYGNAAAFPTPESAAPAPVSPYGVTKLSCENLAQAYLQSMGLDYVALRYFTVYGPRQRPDMAFTRLAAALINNTEFTLNGDGTQLRDVTYVSDVVNATRLAMTKGQAGAAYNIGGGQEVSMLEAIKLFEACAGRSLELRMADFATGDARRTTADTTRARDDLGWTPHVLVAEGVQAHFDWAVSEIGIEGA